VVAGVSALLLAAGCSSGKADTTPTTQPTPSTTAPQLAKARSQFLAASVEFQTAVLRTRPLIMADRNPRDLPAVEGPLLGVVVQYVSLLGRISWPKKAVADGRALERAASAYEQVLLAARDQTARTLVDWDYRFNSAYQAENTAANVVRLDLGLPAITSY
jgi:hypothetical protein